MNHLKRPQARTRAAQVQGLNSSRWPAAAFPHGLGLDQSDPRKQTNFAVDPSGSRRKQRDLKTILNSCWQFLSNPVISCHIQHSEKRCNLSSELDF